MYTVYIIEDENHLRYIGQTQDFSKRLEEHNSGLSFYTRRGRNWKLIYSEIYYTRAEAMKRERYFYSFLFGYDVKLYSH